MNDFRPIISWLRLRVLLILSIDHVTCQTLSSDCETCQRLSSSCQEQVRFPQQIWTIFFSQVSFPPLIVVCALLGNQSNNFVAAPGPPQKKNGRRKSIGAAVIEQSEQLDGLIDSLLIDTVQFLFTPVSRPRSSAKCPADPQAVKLTDEGFP